MARTQWPACGPAVAFELPRDLEATEPAEVRGVGRHDVRLLVGRRAQGEISHHVFAEVIDVLAPGDLLVVNTSATVPAAVDAVRDDGTPLRVHLSTRLAGGQWLVELRSPAGVASRPFAGGRAGEVLWLPAGAAVELVAPFVGSPGPRLWVGSVGVDGPIGPYLALHGSPVRYGHVRRPWPLSAYQTVYAQEPGSAEMASAPATRTCRPRTSDSSALAASRRARMTARAGRAFTPELITALVARGVGVAPVVLHTGVLSPEAHEPPAPERFRVPAATARWVRATRDAGGAVVAVGTSVVRALETVADDDGRVRPGDGWTELVVGPERGVRAVDGLLTGWHEPAASHLRLLEAVAGRPNPPGPLLRGCPGLELPLARVR
ncbi:MAG: S-adenosylmethionine:tRNA ribosyltransferase-isomerase [Acidimicrobiales bacterium]